MSDVSNRIKLIEDNYVYATLRSSDHADFDKVLRISIPGDPVSDGRPRENKKLQIFYNAKKEFLRKIFKKIYKMDPLLQNLCILTPHRTEIRTYALPTAKECKYLSYEDIMSESVYSIGNKDNDNVEKVNYDILQDTEFMIILNDSYMVNNETFKYYSYNPRTEIYVHFSTTFKTELYERKITSSMEYKYYLCSKKLLIDIKHLSDAEIVEYLTIKLIDIKTSATKKMKYLLEGYSASIIDGLFKSFFFSKAQNEFVDKYIKNKSKKEKISLLSNAITASGKKRGDIISGLNKDPKYSEIVKKNVEENLLAVA